jgi:hypothetical protein
MIGTVPSETGTIGFDVIKYAFSAGRDKMRDEIKNVTGRAINGNSEFIPLAPQQENFFQDRYKQNSRFQFRNVGDDWITPWGQVLVGDYALSIFNRRGLPLGDLSFCFADPETLVITQIQGKRAQNEPKYHVPPNFKETLLSEIFEAVVGLSLKKVVMISPELISRVKNVIRDVLYDKFKSLASKFAFTEVSDAVTGDPLYVKNI